jgi:hypothetical protein
MAIDYQRYLVHDLKKVQTQTNEPKQATDIKHGTPRISSDQFQPNNVKPIN